MRAAFRRLGDLAVGTALVLLIWEAASAWMHNPILFPGPASVVGTGWAMLASGEITADVLASLGRIVVGYVIGTLLGIGMGVLLGQVALLDRFINPVISFLRMLPPIALIPLFIIWFGIGETSKYAVVVWATVIAVMFNTLDGVVSTPRNRILAARCLGASRWRVVADVVLPSAVPSMWTGMRLAVGLAFTSVVAAELIAATKGIGALIMTARVLIEIDKMFVGLALLALVGGLSDRIVGAFGRWVLRKYIVYVSM